MNDSLSSVCPGPVGHLGKVLPVRWSLYLCNELYEVNRYVNNLTLTLNNQVYFNKE